MMSSNEKVEALVASVSGYCATYLNEEFQALCIKIIKKLARNRSRPLETGTLEVWAAAVIHAAGMVNFLFDKSAEMYVPPESLAMYFGCARVSMENRSRQIRALFKMRPLDAEFSVSVNRNSKKASYAETDRMLSDIASLIRGRGIRPEVLAEIKQLQAEKAAEENPSIPPTPPALEDEYAAIAAKLKAVGPTKAIERSLRGMIERHPEFAPAYDSLAYVLEYQGLDVEAKAVRAKKPAGG